MPPPPHPPLNEPWEYIIATTKHPGGVHQNSTISACLQDNLPRMFEIPVRRNHIFEDSHRAIMSCKNKEHLKARLWVKFEGEVGLDYGGVSR